MRTKIQMGDTENHSDTEQANDGSCAPGLRTGDDCNPETDTETCVLTSQTCECESSGEWTCAPDNEDDTASEDTDSTGPDTQDTNPEDTGESSCGFSVDASISLSMGTVGIVEWSMADGSPISAEIIFALSGAASDELNIGGVAPVKMDKQDYKTMLLGMKQNRAYTFFIRADMSDGTTCESETYDIDTNSLTGAPQLSRSATTPSTQAGGFIMTCGGVSSSMPAVVIDADGDVVWSSSAPTDCSRVLMDWEGDNIWMISTNATNNSGEMRRVSMDGSDKQNNVNGLSRAHHDFTVLPDGIVAALSWRSSGTDVESDLLLRSLNGDISTAFRVGSNLYPGGPSELGGSSSSYHANNIIYYPDDDSFIIGDRNPNMYVKVTGSGQPVWQIGGDCGQAVAPACASASWDVNHGHHMFENGSFVIFSNGPFMSSTPSRVYELSLNESGGGLSATQKKDYASSSNAHSDSLGDVQRLPNGNTLIVFSNAGRIEELSSSWQVVQTITTNSFGYINWRETLYGPPTR